MAWHAAPAAGQEWTVQAGTGWLNFGPLVREADWYARLGNMGSDVYFDMAVERSLGARRALYFELLLAPTTMSVWPRSTGDGELDRFSHRPFPGTASLTSPRDIYTASMHRSSAVTWSCGSAGLSFHAGVVRAGGGLAACGLSGLDPAFWGSSGLRAAPGLEAELEVRLPVTTSFQLGAECAANPLLNHRGFVRLREHGGVTGLLGAGAAVELPRLEPRRLALPLRCGVAAGVTL